MLDAWPSVISIRSLTADPCPSIARSSAQTRSSQLRSGGLALKQREAQRPVVADRGDTPNRWPVASLIGVCPFGLQERPCEHCERNPVSSCQSRIPPSRPAFARTFG